MIYKYTYLRTRNFYDDSCITIFLITQNATVKRLYFCLLTWLDFDLCYVCENWLNDITQCWNKEHLSRNTELWWQCAVHSFCIGLLSLTPYTTIGQESLRHPEIWNFMFRGLLCNLINFWLCRFPYLLTTLKLISIFPATVLTVKKL